MARRGSVVSRYSHNTLQYTRNTLNERMSEQDQTTVAVRVASDKAPLLTFSRAGFRSGQAHEFRGTTL